MISKHIIFLMSPFVVFFSANAMQMGGAIQSPSVNVINKTGETVAIQFQRRGEPTPTTKILVEDESYNVGHSEPLQLFSITSKAGYWGTKNFSRDIRMAHNTQINKNLEVEIVKSGLIFPYTLKFNYLEVEPKQELHSVFDIFTEVKGVSDVGGKIKPSLFLGTEENTPFPEIQAKYEVLKNKWEPKARAGSQLAQHVMKFVDAAYEAERAGPFSRARIEVFDNLVAEERETPELFYE